MSTQLSSSALLQRVAARAGIGVWRERGTVLVGLAATAVVVGYMAFGTGGLALGTAAAGASANRTDCADTVLSAIADKSGSTTEQAYQCMAPTFQERVPEATFAEQLQARAVPNPDSVARLGDYKDPAGGTMVYYAVDGNGQSVGYIVYLGQDGKVQRID
jgi:hypothetical protein